MVGVMRKGSYLTDEQRARVAAATKIAMMRDSVRLRARLSHFGKRSVEKHSDETKRLMAEKAEIKRLALIKLGLERPESTLEEMKALPVMATLVSESRSHTLNTKGVRIW